MAIAREGRITVIWDPPADTTIEVTDYAVYRIQQGGSSSLCLSSTQRYCDILSAAGEVSTFQVTAIGPGGISERSPVVGPVTPYFVTNRSPQNVQAVAGNAQATVSWSAPSDNGGSPIQAYRAFAQQDTSKSCATTGALTCTVTGLTNGKVYTFVVVARNAVNWGSYSSESQEVLPGGGSGAPGVPTLTSVIGNNAAEGVAVFWSAPRFNGFVLKGYIVRALEDTTKACPAPGALVTVCSIEGLSPATPYTFVVYGTSSLGRSAPSNSISITLGGPAIVPDAPSAPTATPGTGQATVSWTAPYSTGGSPITGYRVNATQDTSKGCTAIGSTSCTVTGLTNGTWAFQVRSINVVGAGVPSAASPSISVLTLPGAPTAVSAVASSGQAVVSWTAPVSNGGSAITAYKVVAAQDTARTCTTTGALTCTVTGLTNGTSYSFKVTATNAKGTGPGDSSAAVLPLGLPDAPTAVKGIADSGKVTVSWTASASNGGTAITGYTVKSAQDYSKSCTTTSALTCAVTGLENGTSYTFFVTATNSLGTSPASAVSAAVTPASVPGAPTGVAATAGNGQATISWSAPASNGGSAVTAYKAYAISDTAKSCTTTGALTCTVSGLTNGATYVFAVKAANGAGTGAASAASAPVTLPNVPGAPSGVVATAGNTQVTVAWVAPASNGGSGVTGYKAYAISDTAKSCTTTGALTCVVSGLTNGTVYTFAVKATNALGTGTVSTASASVTPVGAPDVPTGVVAIAGNGQASVSWTAPASNGGSTITGYKAFAVSDTTKSCTTTGALTCLVTGLANGTAYTFSVKAVNAIGASPASAASASATPATAPDAPTGVVGTSGNAQVTVAWTAPASNGGSPITAYKAYAVSDTAKSCSTTGALTCVVTGLTNGSAYAFAVKATNGAGTGTASSASASVTPVGAPGAPGTVTTVAGNGQASVTWVAPASNGGSAITGYKAYAVSDTTKSCATGGALTCVVTGLTNGTAYTFAVKATNALGTGSASPASASTTPVGAPDAPTGVTAVSGNAQVTVSWTAPASNGGSAITSYKAYAVSDTTKNCTATVSLLCGIGGLTNGTAYTFAVTATNTAGTSAASAASAPATPMTVPGAPTSLSAVPGNTEVTVSWTAPASNGGSAITTYKAYAVSDTTKSCVTTGALTCVVTGLTNGTVYTFVVKATNVLGTGPASAVSAGAKPSLVTAADLPSAPNNVTAAADLPGQVTVTWTAPTSQGTSAITGYKAYLTSDETRNCTTTGLTCAVTGLTNGAASTFEVVALNANGQGPASTPSASATPFLTQSWVTRTSGTTQNFAGIAWNGSQLIAVGAAGTILTSPDGLTWTAQTSGTTNNLAGVASLSGSGRVAVGASGTILTSSNGTTWTTQTSGTTNSLNGVAGSGSLWVAVGSSGTILTSPDGVTWTSRTSNVVTSLRNVAWNGSLWVAVGSSGTFITSPDGVTWTTRVSGSGSTSYGVVWTGTQWVVAGGPNALVRTSPDGITWTARPPGITSTRAIFALAWAGASTQTGSGQLVYVGGSGDVAASADGVDAVAQNSALVGSNLFGVVWTGSRFVAVASGGGIMTTP